MSVFLFFTYEGGRKYSEPCSAIGEGEKYPAESVGVAWLALCPGLFIVVSSVLKSPFKTPLIQSRTSVILP